jgi:uncharacterized protein YeaO (DUF488 family)
MIKVKHFLEAIEPDDGMRVWIEPFGLTRDLREWCVVSFVLPHLGPPRPLWQWFEDHPDEYGEFRGRYHEYLDHSPYLPVLMQLARDCGRENVTLLHQGDDPAHNSGVAMYEFISELAARCPPE